MRTTEGPRRVDVIYRRIDDARLDPLAFRADSMLGVPGLLSVYRAGGVVLANAIGTGVADDKSIYPYVPEMIRFTSANNRSSAISPPVPESGGPALRAEQSRADGGQGGPWRRGLRHAGRPTFHQRGAGGLPPAPAGQSGQLYRPDTLALSTCPTFVEEGLSPRHIDLRPYVLSGQEMRLVPGGLTRVALTEGSLVVNSSQGGGTKDTGDGG